MISTNVYIVGFSSAAKYYGDGSSLTGLTGAVLGAANTFTATNTFTSQGTGATYISSANVTGLTVSGNVRMTATGSGNVRISSLTVTGYSVFGGDTATSGSVVGTLFKSKEGSVSSPTSTWSTLITFGSINERQFYLVSAGVGPINDAVNYSAFGVLVIDGSSAYFLINTPGNVSYFVMQMSGLSLQGNQASGNTRQLYATALRIK
jgi:hypothetical protein